MIEHLLHDENDVNREIDALSNYLFQRGFREVNEVVSFMTLYLAQTLAVALAYESIGKASKEEVVKEAMKFLRQLYSSKEFEKLMADVYDEVQALVQR